MWAKYLWSSIEVPGPEVQVLCDVAKRTKTFVVMGINERDAAYRGRMYNSILYISDQGHVMGTHRKICPTTTERLFHTPGGGGANLRAVFPSCMAGPPVRLIHRLMVTEDGHMQGGRLGRQIDELQGLVPIDRRVGTIGVVRRGVGHCAVCSP